MPLRLLDDSVRAYVRPDLVQAGPRPRLRTSPRSTGTLTAWRSTSTPASSSTAGLIANGNMTRWPRARSCVPLMCH